MTGLCEPFNLAKEMGINLTSPTGGPRARRSGCRRSRSASAT